MIGSEYTQVRLVHGPEFRQCRSCLACRLGAGGKPVTGGQSVRMVGAEYPNAVRYELAEHSDGMGRVAAVTSPDGDVEPGAEYIGVVGSLNPDPVGQDLAQHGKRTRRIPGAASPDGPHVPRPKGIRIVCSHQPTVIRFQFSQQVARGLP